MIEYPLIIHDKEEHSRMIRDIAREVAETFRPLITEEEPLFITVAEFKKKVGRYTAMNLIKNGDIHVNMLYGKNVILMKNYKKWQSKLK